MTRRARLFLRCAALVALIASWGAACGDDGGEVTGPRETPNQSPVAVGEIEAQTAFLGDTVAVDVSRAFRDPDGDPLTFMAASSDPSVVGASVSGSRVSVVGVSRGSATVTVTARDADGLEATLSFEVTVPNRPPAVVGEIEAQTIFVGETATVDASAAFSDPDGDELSFAAASSDTASVLASVSGSEVTLEALKRGSAMVTVAARDADGLEATLSFEVTVPNRPPAVVGEIEAQTIFVGETATVDASAAFSDPDGDELSFAAASSDTASVLASVSGSEVTLEALKRGSAMVTVAARDADGLEATLSFEVTVPNRPPAVVGEIEAQTIFVGETATVDASAAFSDPDGDELSFAAASSDTASVLASVSGSEVTLEALKRGSAMVTVAARDADGLEATLSFEVTVPNRPPAVVGEIEAQTIFVGETATVDASAAFSDPDGDELSFAAASSDTASVLASVSGSEVTLEALKRGSAMVTVAARDADGLEATLSFEVTVPNRPPAVVGEIEAQTIFVGETATVDASAAFSDPDGDELSFAAASSDTASVLASVSGSEVTLEALKRGSAMVTVAARDADGLEATLSFEVTVPNRPPAVARELSPQTLLPGGTITVDLSAAFADPDGDTLHFEAASSEPAVVAASTAGSQITLEGLERGTATVTVTARDPDGAEVSQSFEVTVRNQAPVVVHELPSRILRPGQTVKVDVSSAFSDPDGDPLTFEATSSDMGVANASAAGSEVVVGGVSEGTATLTVTATDPGGLQARQQFGVTVEAQGSTNQAPEVTGTIADRTAIRGGELPVQAYGYFTDPDGNDSDLQYTAGTSNAAVATVSRTSPAVFYVTAVSDGQAVITVTAQDPGGLTASTSFTFAVGNNAPRVKAEAPAVTSSPGQIDWLVLSRYFEETDVGDQLNFSASSTNSGVASVSVQFSAVYGYYAEVGGVAAGEATINMTATDRGGLTASTSSLVTVTANRPPRVSRDIGTQTLAVGDTLTWNLSDHFSDPDNDQLTYTAAGGYAVSASVTGSTFTLVGVSAGISPVRVTATDPSGRTADIDFFASVTVPNGKPVVAGAIPAQTVDEGATTTVDVASYFSDPDDDELDFGASSSNAEVAGASVSGSRVTIDGVTVGSASVTVTARDPHGGEARQSFGVTVRRPPPPNQRPVVSSVIPAQTVTENESVSVDLDGHFRDPEGGSLDYGATSSNEGVATADISGSDVVVGGVSEGTATLTVTATDPGGLQARQQFGVTVEAQGSTNQAPEVTGTIADRTAIRGGELAVLAYGYFTDPDGNDSDLQYTAGTSNAAVATVSRTSNPAVFYVTAVSDGQAVITVTAQDPGGLTASTSFTFAVGNNAPRVKAEAPAVTSSPGQIDWLVLSRYFEETDVGDQLNFSASSTNSGVASVSVQFSAVYGYYAKVGGVTPGEATINMTATDRGGLTASTSSLVTVTANRPPRVSRTIGNQTLAVGDTLTWNLSDHFSDPDNDQLTYTAAGGYAVSASVTGSTFTLVGVSAGISPVRVTATDPSGRTAEITFFAFVSASQSIEGLARRIATRWSRSTSPPTVRTGSGTKAGSLTSHSPHGGGYSRTRRAGSTS